MKKKIIALLVSLFQTLIASSNDEIVTLPVKRGFQIVSPAALIPGVINEISITHDSDVVVDLILQKDMEMRKHVRVIEADHGTDIVFVPIDTSRIRLLVVHSDESGKLKKEIVYVGGAPSNTPSPDPEPQPEQPVDNKFLEGLPEDGYTQQYIAKTIAAAIPQVSKGMDRIDLTVDDLRISMSVKPDDLESVRVAFGTLISEVILHTKTVNEQSDKADWYKWRVAVNEKLDLADSIDNYLVAVAELCAALYKEE
jgi:hypothetical protein